MRYRCQGQSIVAGDHGVRGEESGYVDGSYMCDVIGFLMGIM